MTEWRAGDSQRLEPKKNSRLALEGAWEVEWISAWEISYIVLLTRNSRNFIKKFTRQLDGFPWPIESLISVLFFFFPVLEIMFSFT